MRLALLPGAYAVCRLRPREAVPAWVAGLDGPLVSITRTAEELSIVAPAARVPADVQAEGPWTALAVEGPLDFALVGVLHELSGVLARAEVSTFVLSTYDTDLLLVRAERADAAVAALRAAGHEVA